ncbi:similar to Saccharomyces cerevisiae YIL156W-B Putative protein of unknown function [Geotrichum candidum]|uniref:DUF1748-domain-containing protein n=1 Tax=Geotrichum candidum TaxID=1173061 RepID=A0A0J9X6S7_GEOCN|nr:similar to Saccharomyces cerevisiae YIL156W-B Putative protein of unknown function [Geotrichum candidum]
MGYLSRIAHISLDLVLVSTALAGIRRSTGLTPKTDIFDSKDFQSYFQKYLNTGEWVFDSSVAFMGASEYFVRK